MSTDFKRFRRVNKLTQAEIAAFMVYARVYIASRKGNQCAVP